MDKKQLFSFDGAFSYHNTPNKVTQLTIEWQIFYCLHIMLKKYPNLTNGVAGLIHDITY